MSVVVDVFVRPVKLRDIVDLNVLAYDLLSRGTAGKQEAGQGK